MPNEPCPALARIAAIAPTLKEAQLRTLIYLATAADPETAEIRVSTRELSARTSTEVRKVAHSLSDLAERNILTICEKGSGRTTTLYRVEMLRTLDFPREVFRTPPMSTGPGLSDPPPESREVFRTPPIAPLGGLSDLPGRSLGPHPTIENKGPELAAQLPRARIEDSIEPYSIDQRVAAVLTAKPADFDPDLIASAQRRMDSYMVKWRTKDPPAQPADPEIAAQFLAIANWDTLEGLLQQLAHERQEPYPTYGWFISVGLQRLAGIAPATLKQQRDAFKQLRRKPAGSEAEQQRLPDIAAIAAKKSF